MATDEAEVSYTVKELLEKLDRRIGEFMALLASKADHTLVVHLVERVDSIDDRVGTLELSERTRAKHFIARQDFRRWIVPTVVSAAAVAAALLQVFHP